MTMNRRKRTGRRNIYALQFEELEAKSLLAGVVFVQANTDGVVIKGDAASNQFVVNLDATNVDELVIGIDTEVRMVGTERSYDSLNVPSLLIKLNRGHDSVVVKGNASIVGSSTIQMGAGNDSVFLLGSEDGMEFQNDLWVWGQNGMDSFFATDLTVNEDFRFYGQVGSDIFAVNDIDVLGHSSLYGLRAADEFLIADSRMNSAGVMGSFGNDFLATVDSDFQARVRYDGQGDFDYFYESNCTFIETPLDRSVERQLTNLTTNIRAQASFDDMADWLFEHAANLPSDVADCLQDELSDFSDKFGLKFIQLELDPVTQTVSVNDPTPTISVRWDQAVQQAVANEGVGPTIGSRAYGMMHTAMYDAWSAFNQRAVSTQLGDDLQRPSNENTEANKEQAMSFAAFRVLDDLFEDQSTIFEELMQELGYDSSDASVDPTTPAGIGNLMANALLDYRHQDGSNQLGDDANGEAGVAYSDVTGYEPQNPVGDPDDIELWTPENVPIDSTGGSFQSFLTPHWGQVESFSLESGDEYRPVAPEPFLLVEGTVDLDAKTITLADSTELAIDSSLVGTIINPRFITQAEEVVTYSANLTDEQKLIAEFWEDGGGTSFPPGTFLTFGEFVSGRDNHSLDEDAQMFFMLGNAVFDAGIATWEAKSHYDYVRPVRAIRELGELGLIGEFDAGLGGYAIDAWVPEEGTQRILATEFLTYQTPGSDPSPPFAEYTSGHSAFSAAAAEILKRFTGDNTFGGSVTFETGDSRFEPGITPASSTTLYWDTFTAAADEAGLSRLYGGIHFEDGDVNGRTLGSEVGVSTFLMARSYIYGTA